MDITKKTEKRPITDKRKVRRLIKLADGVYDTACYGYTLFKQITISKDSKGDMKAEIVLTRETQFNPPKNNRENTVKVSVQE